MNHPGRYALVALLGLLPVPLLAHSSARIARCVKAAKPVEIDGKLTDWDRAESIRIAHDQVSYGEKPTNDSDASYLLYSLWDGKALYLASVVQDSSLVATHEGRLIYENDCVEIGIDAQHDSEDGTYGQDDFQFVFSVPLRAGAPPLKRIYRNPTSIDPEAPDVQLAFQRIPGGYVFEAAIPWPLLGISKPPGPMTVLGFQNDLRDRDGDGSSAGIAWNPCSDPMASPLQFGHLVLVETTEQDLASLAAQFREEANRIRRLLDDTAEEKDHEATVTLGDPTGIRLSRGIGWNVQFYDGQVPPWSDSDWQAFLALLRWTRPAWVRYGLNLGQWEPANDDGDPRHFQWDGFAFDSPIMRHHYRLLDFFETENVDVMLCNWYVGDPATGASWLSERRGDRDAPTDHPFHLDAPSNDDEFVESLAALVHHLKIVKNYRCVRFLSIWNEPDGHWTYSSPKAEYPKTFWPIYRKLDERLRSLGLRDQIGLAGPDTATSSYPALLQIPRFIDTYESPLDLIVTHDYNAFFDHHRPKSSTRIGEALGFYRTLMGELGDAAARRGRARPEFAVTEYGNHGNGPGPVEGAFDVFKGTLANQEFVLRSLPLGISGYLRWEFKPYGRSWQNFGALTKIEPGYRFAPHSPVYYPQAMLTRYSRKGAAVLATEVRGARDEFHSPRVNAAAVEPVPGHLTLWLANSGRVAKPITIRFGPHGDRAGDLTGLLFDATCRHEYPPLPMVLNGDTGQCTLPPRSLAVLTTLEKPGSPELALPLGLAPKTSEPAYASYDVGGFPRTVVSFGFEDPVEWDIWRSHGGRSAVATSENRAARGKKSCALQYDFFSADTQGREEHLVASTPIRLNAVPLELTAQIYGDGSGHLISFTFGDDRGETFESPAPTTLTWVGWKTVELDLQGMSQRWKHWGDTSDGVMDFPIRSFGFVFREREKRYVGRGEVALDDVRILAKPVPPAGPADE